jgi:hypothetical protein
MAPSVLLLRWLALIVLLVLGIVPPQLHDILPTRPLVLAGTARITYTKAAMITALYKRAIDTCRAG